MDVLTSVAILISNNTREERNDFASIVRTTLREVRVDDNGSKSDSTESKRPGLVAQHLLLGDVTLERVVEAVVLSMPLKVLSEVFVPQEVVHVVPAGDTSSLLIAKDVHADTSHEDAVSLLTHFLLVNNFFIISC